MDQSIKEKWVEALRSGDYEQGTGALRQKNERTGTETFCCLGVLCDIVEDEIDGEWKEWSDVTYEFIAGPDTKWDHMTEVLPNPVRDYAGLNDNEPSVRVPDVTGDRTLSAVVTELNDGLGEFSQHSFDEIADAIERSL